MESKQLKKLLSASAVTTFAVGSLFLANAGVAEARGEESNPDTSASAVADGTGLDEDSVALQPEPISEEGVSGDSEEVEGESEVPAVAEERIGNVVVYRRDLEGNIHRLSDGMNENTDISVSQGDKALHVTQNDNWFTFVDNTNSNQGNGYEYGIKLPVGYRVVADDVTLTDPYATYAKQLKAGEGEFSLVDGKQTYFLVIEDATLEKGPAPGETVLGADDLTELGDDVTDIVVRPADGDDSSYDDLTELGDNVVDVVVSDDSKANEDLKLEDPKKPAEIADKENLVTEDKSKLGDKKGDKKATDSVQLPKTGSVFGSAFGIGAILATMGSTITFRRRK